jgi:hypothetical protein
MLNPGWLTRFNAPQQTVAFLQPVVDLLSGETMTAHQRQQAAFTMTRPAYHKLELHQSELWHLGWCWYLPVAAPMFRVDNPGEWFGFTWESFPEDCTLLFAGNTVKDPRFAFDPNWHTVARYIVGKDWPKAPTQRAQGTLWRRGDGNQILARWFFACYAAACVLLWPALVCYLAGRKDSRWANLGSRFVPLADWMKVALDQNETELCL